MTFSFFSLNLSKASIFVILAVAGSCSADDLNAPRDTASVDPAKLFRERIAPVMAARCQACHGVKQEGGYSVSTPARLFSPGDSEKPPIVARKLDESELWRRLITEDESERMPADSEPLSKDQLVAVKVWIEAGASVDRGDVDRSIAGLASPRSVLAPKHYPRPIAINAIALANQSDDIFIGGYAEVTQWNLTSGELLNRIAVAGPLVAAIDVSADTKHLIVSSGSPGQRGVVELIDLKNLNADRVALEATADLAPDIVLSPDGRRAAIGGQDGSLRVVEVLGEYRFGQVVQLTPHADAVLAVAWSADGSRLITASRDRTAKLFDVGKLELIASYDRHDRAVGGAGFSGHRPLSLDETGRLRLLVGDDSDSVLAEQSALPRVLQRFTTVGDEILIADRNRLRRLRTEQKMVDNGKDDNGQPKKKEVTRFREDDSLEVGSSEWITSVTANDTSIAVGTQQGTVTVWERSTHQRRGEFIAKP